MCTPQVFAVPEEFSFYLYLDHLFFSGVLSILFPSLPSRI
nr:MAG TPA: hypothetical protein [Bacteriophage sp.]